MSIYCTVAYLSWCQHVLVCTYQLTLYMVHLHHKGRYLFFVLALWVLLHSRWIFWMTLNLESSAISVQFRIDKTFDT